MARNMAKGIYLQLFRLWIILGKISNTPTNKAMALKPLFLEEKLVQRILLASQKAGKDYWDFLEQAPRSRRTRKVEPETGPVIPEISPITPFPVESDQQFIDRITVKADDETPLNPDEVHATCKKCGANVRIRKMDLMNMRVRRRSVLCPTCKPAAINKSA